MADVEIPEEVLNFMNGAKIGAENGLSESEEIEESSQILEKALQWGFDIFHTNCQEAGLPGLGKMKSSDIAELSGIVLKKYAGNALLEKTPEIMLISILTGTVATNTIAWKRLQKKTNTKKEDIQE